MGGDYRSKYTSTRKESSVGSDVLPSVKGHPKVWVLRTKSEGRTQRDTTSVVVTKGLSVFIGSSRPSLLPGSLLGIRYTRSSTTSLSGGQSGVHLLRLYVRYGRSLQWPLRCRIDSCPHWNYYYVGRNVKKERRERNQGVGTMNLEDDSVGRRVFRNWALSEIPHEFSSISKSLSSIDSEESQTQGS